MYVTIRTTSGSRYDVDEAAGLVRRHANINIYCPLEGQPAINSVWPCATWERFGKIELVPAPVIGEVQLLLAEAENPALEGRVLTSVVTDVIDGD